MADKGLASIYTDKTGIYKHREWRGLKDTAYDYKMWCGLWGILLKWALGHPVTNVKAIFRYRWMFDYLKVPSFYDRIMEGARGA
ncbi:MAG: 2-hydroxyacyl-CoA dehydratase, partial [Oscillospiraceae bacterium]|nr:2-hydroxyacyl-CoA dehydratase [Candidatus Limimonas coprohippi]